jgi:hypothetical protein
MWLSQYAALAGWMPETAELTRPRDSQSLMQGTRSSSIAPGLTLMEVDRQRLGRWLAVAQERATGSRRSRASATVPWPCPRSAAR